MARIDLVDLAHAYGGNDADPASFALKPTLDDPGGRAAPYALLGPSGCGKTTLLNIISGIVRPSRRQGSCSTAKGRHGRSRHSQRNIAQVFQFPVIYDTMTVGEEPGLPAQEPRPAACPDRGGAWPEIARLLDLSPVLDRKANRLVGRRQAEDLARPRAGPRRRGGDPVRRATHGDRSGG